jgi:hypothetical protein
MRPAVGRVARVMVPRWGYTGDVSTGVRAQLSAAQLGGYWRIGPLIGGCVPHSLRVAVVPLRLCSHAATIFRLARQITRRMRNACTSAEARSDWRRSPARMSSSNSASRAAACSANKQTSKQTNPRSPRKLKPCRTATAAVRRTYSAQAAAIRRDAIKSVPASRATLCAASSARAHCGAGPLRRRAPAPYAHTRCAHVPIKSLPSHVASRCRADNPVPQRSAAPCRMSAALRPLPQRVYAWIGGAASAPTCFSACCAASF